MAASMPTTASCCVFSVLPSSRPARPAAEQTHKVLEGGPVSNITSGAFREVPLVLKQLTIQLRGLRALVCQRLQPRHNWEVELVEPAVGRGAEGHAPILFLRESGAQFLNLVDHLAGLGLLSIKPGQILQ